MSCPRYSTILVLLFISYSCILESCCESTSKVDAMLGAHALMRPGSHDDSSRHLYRRSVNRTDQGSQLNSSVSIRPTALKEIYIGLLLPFTFTRRRSEYKGGAKYYAAAFSLAVKSVNEDPYLLPGYELKFTWNDTRCNEKDNILTMYNQFQYREKRGLPVHGFIGLGCECDSAAKFASAMEVPIVSHVSVILFDLTAIFFIYLTIQTFINIYHCC